MLDSSQALTAIQQNFGLLDTAGAGAKDGLVSLNDLKSVLKDQNISPELRDAVNFLINNPAAFNEAETAGQAQGSKPDGYLSTADIAKSLSQSGTGDQSIDGLLKQLEGLQKQIDQLTGGKTGTDAEAPMDAGKAADVLKNAFEQIDAADGKNDGQGTLGGLKQVLNDQNVPQELRDAINRFINNPTEFKELETNRGPVADNIFSLADISDFAKKRPAQGAAADQGGGSSQATGASQGAGSSPSAQAAGGGGSISIGDIATMLGRIASQTETALKEKTTELGKQKGSDLSMEDNRKLQELGEIMKAFSTLFANLIKAVSEAGDKSASKI